jgi:hypothetical protein
VNKEFVENTRAEAEAARNKVPPQYRAKPYDAEPEESKPDTDYARQQFNTSQEKPKISNGFNMSSGFNEDEHTQPDHKTEEKPEPET